MAIIKNSPEFDLWKEVYMLRNKYHEQIKTDEHAWGNYSYQFWITPEGDGYRADGAYGQVTLIWPKYGYVFSFQRPEDDGIVEFLNILREEVLSKL